MRNRPPKSTSDADRRLRQADRLARIFRVLQLIQSRGRWDAKTIARELEVSERTVYRDLTVLELAGVPWSYEKEEACYRVRPDFRFPTVNLTDDELLGQGTAASITSAPGLDVNAGARPTSQKLAANNERAQRLLAEAQCLTEVLDLKLADHRQHQEVIRTIQWALVQRKQLAGVYRSPYEDHPRRLTLHPYRLALVKSSWYLIGKANDEGQPRTYRVVRFKSLRMLDADAVIPKDFDLTAYFGNAWGVYRGQPTYDVEIHFSPDAAEIVTETTWHKTQEAKQHQDGGVTLFFRVDGLNEIVSWIVSWSGRAKVVRPAELRRLVVDEHRRGIAANEE